MMKRINAKEKQMALDFKDTPVRVESPFIRKSIVVNINEYSRSARPLAQPTPVLERLLQEAEKLRW